MNDLTLICGVADVAGMSLASLRECMSYSQAFSLTGAEWMVIAVAGLLGVRVAVFGRKRPLAALEGLLLAPLAAYGGLIGGLLFAQWLPPWLMGVWLTFLTLAALFLLIWSGLVNGTATAGWKILAAIEVGVLATVFATVAWIAFSVPADNAAEGYQSYLNAVTWLFTGAAIVDVLFAGTYGSYNWAVGWFLVPINASWGAPGNLFGIVHHTISWNCFSNNGDIVTDNRTFYTRYADGTRLKYSPSKFAFTQGAVMSSPPVEKHESHHVLQHFIFGPMFTVSYLLWMVPAAIIGLVVGLIKRHGFNGVEAWAYYNNPWEIWAYAIEGKREQKVGIGKAMIWGPITSWIVAILYWISVLSVFIWLMWARH